MVGRACCCAAERDWNIKRHRVKDLQSFWSFEDAWAVRSAARPFPEDSISPKQLHVDALPSRVTFLHRPVLLLTLKDLCWRCLSCVNCSLGFEWDRKEGRKKLKIVSWSRHHSCLHTGEGKSDASQPLLPFTFSDLSRPQEDPPTGISHASENHEVQPFLPYCILRGFRCV